MSNKLDDGSYTERLRMIFIWDLRFICRGIVGYELLSYGRDLHLHANVFGLDELLLKI